MANINTNNSKNNNVDLLKILICAVLASVMLVVMFSINNNQMTELIEETKAKEDSPNLVWFLEHVTATIPTYAAIIIMCIVYGNKEKYVPVKTQKEKLYVSIILAAFAFLMFMYVVITDGEVKVGDDVESLLEKTATWFVAQILPLSVLISYHAIRMGTEKRELEEAVDNQ